MTTRTGLLVALALRGASATDASASSGASFGGPVGATDINNAYLPPLGTLFGGYGNVLGLGDHAYDNEKRATPAPVTIDVNALYLGYVYPFRVAGGSLASGVQGSYWSPDRVQVDKNVPAQHDDGWGDLYVDFLNWSKYVGPLFGEKPVAPSGGPPEPYGLTVKVEYSMIFPTAVYDPNRPFNISGGTYLFIPNAAVTYLTRPDGLGGGVELDLHAFYDHQTTNWQTDYDNGDVIDFDFAGAQRLGRWTVGVAGHYAFEIQDDRIGPTRQIVPPSGRHFESFTLGPVVQFVIPSWHAAIKLKSDLPVITRNAVAITDVVGVLAFAF